MFFFIFVREHYIITHSLVEDPAPKALLTKGNLSVTAVTMGATPGKFFLTKSFYLIQTSHQDDSNNTVSYFILVSASRTFQAPPTGSAWLCRMDGSIRISLYSMFLPTNHLKLFMLVVGQVGYSPLLRRSMSIVKWHQAAQRFRPLFLEPLVLRQTRLRLCDRPDAHTTNTARS